MIPKMKLVDITVKRTIPASADKVFDAWMDPKCPGGPWFESEALIMAPAPPAVGSLYYFTVLWDGHTWAHYGRFVEIQRPGKVEYTWVGEGTKGVESTVSVTFEARAKETEVTLRHTNIPDDELGRQTEFGWAHILDSVAQALAKKSANA
ncbi:MAG TPA: SRPBCC domain-containing protein [Candidatus Deferrimicrobiaceae bacterium]|nr:SRPBCC domain-containing protein [Candidatus Deferrimicrobiaceae bacterium]